MSEQERADYWANNALLADGLREECRACQRLYEAVFELKRVRARIELLGVRGVPPEAYPPPATELRHLAADKVARLLAALDKLDGDLLTPVRLGDATLPPLAAVVAVARS